MQKWRERIIILAAIVSDIGLFGSILYFVVLTKLADEIQVDFIAWFFGLGVIALGNEWRLRRGVSLRGYVWQNLILGGALCVSASFWYATEPFSWWGQVWFYGMMAASVVHCAYLSFHKPELNTGLLYLDGTIAALVLTEIWEHLTQEGQSSSLGMFLVFSIGMNFLALLIRTVSAQPEKETEKEDTGADMAENGRFPFAVPILFLAVLTAGMFLSVWFGNGISEGLIGMICKGATVLWKWIRSAGELFYRGMLWLAERMAKDDTGSLALTPIPEVSSQAADAGQLMLPEWVFPALILAAAAMVLLLVLLLGKLRLKKAKVVKNPYKEEPMIRRRSGSVCSMIWKRIKEQAIYIYRYLFHPEDIRMLVKCAQNYGRRKKVPMEMTETLKVYFTRLSQIPETASAAVRLQELSEQYYYAKERPVLTPAEGKKIQKKFRGR